MFIVFSDSSFHAYVCPYMQACVTKGTQHITRVVLYHSSLATIRATKNIFLPIFKRRILYMSSPSSHLYHTEKSNELTVPFFTSRSYKTNIV